MSEQDEHAFPQLVQVRVALEKEGAWPPFHTEVFWAQPLGYDQYQIKSVIFFCEGLDSEDIITAYADENGNLIFEEVVEDGNYLSLVAIFDTSGNEREQLAQALLEKGCLVAAGHNRHVLGVAVPPSVDAEEVAVCMEAYSAEELFFCEKSEAAEVIND